MSILQGDRAAQTDNWEKPEVWQLNEKSYAPERGHFFSPSRLVEILFGNEMENCNILAKIQNNL